uniref:Integrase catalytic domain-containing protein n=1 Tax=Dictyoglomus thermophilum TaxID=14 RepID=A0A7C3RLM0_DICTH
MRELGIIQIYAESSQAKGRIVRFFKTLQCRLKEELRIEGIKDIESANISLKGFIERYNKKFCIEFKILFYHL